VNTEAVTSVSTGDSLSFQSGDQFSTYDEDHDRSDSNCAVTYKGGWWYNSCYKSNLNGKYYYGGIIAEDGIAWSTLTGNQYSLKTTEMKIRPV